MCRDSSVHRCCGRYGKQIGNYAEWIGLDHEGVAWAHDPALTQSGLASADNEYHDHQGSTVTLPDALIC